MHNYAKGGCLRGGGWCLSLIISGLRGEVSCWRCYGVGLIRGLEGGLWLWGWVVGDIEKSLHRILGMGVALAVGSGVKRRVYCMKGQHIREWGSTIPGMWSTFVGQRVNETSMGKDKCLGIRWEGLAQFVIDALQ